MQGTSTDQVSDTDRRRHERIDLCVNGRLMVPDGQEFSCKVTDISLVGIALDSDADVLINDHLIIYLDDLGRFEGPVCRFLKEGFAIELKLADTHRVKVEERIQWLSNMQRGENDEAANLRQFQRHLPDSRSLGTTSKIILDNGEQVDCKVLDMSLSGVLVGTQLRLPIGSPVTIGRMKGHVVRHYPEGLGIQFDNVPNHPMAASRPFGKL